MLVNITVSAAVLSLVVCIADVDAQDNWTRGTRAVVDALRSGGLPAAADVAGHYVGVENDDFEGVVAELFDLATSSDIVVSGRITSTSAPTLSLNNHMIVTDLQLTVLDAFKGTLLPGSIATLRMKGGRIQFSNGTSAELRSSRNQALVVGDECVFFLKRISIDPDVYVPTFGSQGVFAFDSQSHVRPHARTTDEVFKQNNGISRPDFIARVRTATGS